MSERGGFAMPPAERAHELLLKCDRSRDGVLQADEFTRFFKVVVGSALKKRQADGAHQVEERGAPVEPRMFGLDAREDDEYQARLREQEWADVGSVPHIPDDPDRAYA